MIHLPASFGPNTFRIFVRLVKSETEHRGQWVDCTCGEDKTETPRAISLKEEAPACDIRIEGNAVLSCRESELLITG